MQPVAILKHTAYWGAATLLGAAESLVFKRRDTAGLVSGRRIFTDRLAVAKEIFLEIVNHADRFAEQILGFTTVHQYGFGTEHLGNLGENGSSALRHEPVGEASDKRIGCDTAKSVTTAALQSDTQLAHWHIHTHVLAGSSVQLAQQIHAHFKLVTLDLLHHKKLYTLLIVVTKKLGKLVRLVVLAP